MFHRVLRPPTRDAFDKCLLMKLENNSNSETRTSFLLPRIISHHEIVTGDVEAIKDFFIKNLELRKWSFLGQARVNFILFIANV